MSGGGDFHPPGTDSNTAKTKPFADKIVCAYLVTQNYFCVCEVNGVGRAFSAP